MKKFVRKTRSWGLPSWYRGYLGGMHSCQTQNTGPRGAPGGPRLDYPPQQQQEAKGAVLHRAAPQGPLGSLHGLAQRGPQDSCTQQCVWAAALRKGLPSASSNWPAVGPQPRFTPQQGRASLAQTLRGGEKHPSPGPVNPLPHPENPQNEQRPLESSERSPPTATTARGGGRLRCAGGRAWGVGHAGTRRHCGSHR